MGLVGVIWYKTISERFPGKHHKIFADNKNIVQIKTDQLLKSGVEHVFISTNDTNVQNTDKVTYIKRDEKYCNNTLKYPLILKEIFDSIPVSENQDTVITFSCCPLFSRYDEMYDEYLKSNTNQIAVHPSTHFYLDVNKRPINFNFGMWHSVSQDIDPVYLFPYAGTMCKMKDLLEVYYVIPINFNYFNINQFEAIDIDYEEEFRVAQEVYKWM
tara:strand:- start:1347 stop:1988 length:642 start_codon:yes stop_codon:yes gene_type:complete